MRRRLVWGLTALVTVLVVPAPGRSESASDGAPKVHVAGVGLHDPAGGPRSAPIPHLVRPGSERRSEPGGSSEPSRGGGALAPVTVPPGVFNGVPDLRRVSPGDPTGALGQTHHVAAVNVHMNVFDRTTGDPELQHRRLRSLDPKLPSGAVDFDPKVVYDPYRDHFLLTFLASTDTKSFLSIVVIPEASVENPAGWCTLHMSGDQVAGNGKQFADYPMIGFTEDRVTLTTNQFDFSRAPDIGRFRYVQVLSIRKAPLYDCSVPVVPIKVFSRKQTKDPDGSKAFTIVPTVSFGGSPKAQFMTSMDFNGSRGKLVLWRLRKENGGLRLARAQIASARMTFPPWGLQCGSTSNPNTWWDTGDVRLTSSFWDVARGRIYTATAIEGNFGGGGIESVVRWWEVDPAAALGSSTVTRKGRVGAPGRDAAWPSVATDADGKLWVNYAQAGIAGPDECLSAYAAVVQQGATGASSVRIQVGHGRYEFSQGIERWGDYTAVTRDPVDPTVMATYGAHPVDDGITPATRTRLWRQVIATLEDV